MRREAEALACAGHEVAVLCLRGPGEAAREDVGGVDVRRLPLARRRGGAGRYLWDYARFFAAALAVVSGRQWRRPYDVVQVNTLPDALVWAAWPARRLGAKVVLDFHELMPELFASRFRSGLGHPLPRLLARLEPRAAAAADHCLAVSEPCLDRYVERGARRDRFTIVMNSADPRLFPVTEPAAAGPPWRVVSHGSLVDRYGYAVLVEAAALLRDLPGLTVEVLGEGEAAAGLDGLIDELGLRGRVVLTGPVPLEHMADRLRGAALGVSCNLADPFTDLVVPTKVMEYISLGIPAMASATAAARATFEPSSVRLLPPGDPAALAGAIRELLADEAARLAMARRAQATFLPRCGWPVMAARYVALLEGLVGEDYGLGEAGWEI